MPDAAPEVATPDNYTAPPKGEAGEGFLWQELSDENDRSVDDDEVEKPAAEVKEPAKKKAPVKEPEASSEDEEDTELEVEDEEEEEDLEDEDAESSEEEPPAKEEAEVPESLQAPEQPQITPEQHAEWLAKRTQELTAGYAFDEDTAEKLTTEPAAVLPGLAAKMHLAIVNDLMQALPGVIRKEVSVTTQAQAREAKAQQQFYSAFPELKVVDQKTVFQLGAIWRAKNPKATPDEAIQGIGKLVAAAEGITLGERPKPAQMPAQKVRKPFKPATSSGSAKPKAKPQPTPPGTVNWSEMADD